MGDNESLHNHDDHSHDPAHADRHLTPTEAEIVAAMNGVRRIVRALRLSSRASEKAFGVSAAQLFVLQQLAEIEAHHDAAPSIAKLASLTATDPSSVSVVVSRLAAHGLCARKASKADGRRAEVTITPAGTELLQRAPQPVQARMITALQAMAPERRRELVVGLEEIVGALGVADHAASMFFEEEHDDHHHHTDPHGPHS